MPIRFRTKQRSASDDSKRPSDIYKYEWILADRKRGRVMQVHDEFSGTITLTENSSRELFKVLEEQDEAFINDVLDGRCGFTLKSADGRSVELVPNTNKRCQCVGSVGADRKTEPTCSKMEQVDEPQTCSVNGRPYSECGRCEHFRCTADEPQTERKE